MYKIRWINRPELSILSFKYQSVTQLWVEIFVVDRRGTARRFQGGNRGTGDGPAVSSRVARPPSRCLVRIKDGALQPPRSVDDGVSTRPRGRPDGTGESSARNWILARDVYLLWLSVWGRASILRGVSLSPSLLRHFDWAARPTRLASCGDDPG
jgi:hypothetical protein